MTYDELIEHFKTLAAASAALGEDRRTVEAWKRRRVPSKHQMKAEHLSGGALKADDQARTEARELASYLPPAERSAA